MHGCSRPLWWFIAAISYIVFWIWVYFGLGGGDFAAEAGALFFCKRKNAQKAPLTGSGVFCAFNLYGDGLKRTDLAYACVASLRLWRMGCQSFRENIFGKCGGFLAVVYHIFLMWETVFDDQGPPRGLAGG